MTFRDSREARVGEAIHRYENSVSTDELNRRAEERVASRPSPNKGSGWRFKLGVGLGLVALLPAAYVGVRSTSTANASGPNCVGSQTLTVPEGGLGPIDLVDRNVAGNADPESIPIDVDMTGRGQMLAGEAGFSLPEGVSVQAPVTCIE